MAPVSSKVEAALITYFQRPDCCGDIPFDRTTNIYHVCGFDVGATAWRAIAYDINQLPALKAANLCINPSTRLDACTSIADIEGILVPRPAPAAMPAPAPPAAPATKPKPKAKSAAKKAKARGAAKKAKAKPAAKKAKARAAAKRARARAAAKKPRKGPKGRKREKPPRYGRS
jgi:hypothetical protein